ncbi:glycoside hydrolase [Polaribacter reichenbachii]|uniref:Glycoside hydrolase n=1 Tax=Polaribacter reichenbachii TaxID=996801 RepID=A0A1B8TV80_9FLAO|nr:trehalase family glycosidase [Polaribacter reichenbachii]APZ45502.1 glycoside hydrolase [Polaribacter reichenbachii]AUC19363.1 glycoside hydrolase [Polaribacter reichenbachii]OBY63482.1 glycoside hydrolase [Polaribacter reichenbachii]
MENLQEKAKEILNNNWKGSFSIPCANLYPFQWKWDSGFIAIGLAHFNMQNAEKEIETLLDAQWDNGFIPHIIFHTENDSYFPGANFHRSELHPLSSKKYKSTGMTQPPVTGFVLEDMYKISKDKSQTLQYLKTVIDKVYFNHEYFYNNRDPKNEGLVYIYHNWESGTDNSPIWDDIWATMNPPEYTFERRDTTHVDASERPSKREYDHYLHIIEIAKANNYSDEKIAELSPFLVQDPLFNAMLIKSNESLINLYEEIGGNADKIDQLKKWQEQSIKSFKDKLFDDELGAYIHYDLRNEKPLRHLTSSSFSPLFANIPSQERADKMVKVMLEKFGGEHQYLCASFDPDSDRFNPKKYWRGPVWVNLNWMLFYGLKNYGYNDVSERVKQDTISIVEKNGFYEYFDSRKEMHTNGKAGYGGGDFSWSAALLLDMLNN